MALLLPPLRGRDRGRAPLDVAGQRQRRTPDLPVRPAPLDPDVDVDARASRTSSASRRGPPRPAPRAPRAATSRTCDQGTPGTGSRSTRSSSGWSRSSARTGCGLRSMQPRLATHASPAASSSTISSAVRPDGKVSVATRIHSGRLSGARFWKNGSFSIPSTKRLSAIGRPRDAGQGPVGDRQEVRDDVELRVPRHREVHLVGVADRDLAAADLEDLLARRHGSMLAAAGKRGEGGAAHGRPGGPQTRTMCSRPRRSNRKPAPVGEVLVDRGPAARPRVVVVDHDPAADSQQRRDAA